MQIANVREVVENQTTEQRATATVSWTSNENRPPFRAGGNPAILVVVGLAGRLTDSKTKAK